MELNIDEKIKDEQLNFISNIKDMDNDEKRLYHFNSVLNLSNGIIKYNDADSNSLKKLIIKYFEEINDLKDSLIDKKQSFYFYREYLLPIGRHLIKKADYRTKSDILKYIILGFILDLIVFIFIMNRYYIIFTFIFLLMGYFSRKRKIKKNKFFSTHW